MTVTNVESEPPSTLQIDDLCANRSDSTTSSCNTSPKSLVTERPINSYYDEEHSSGFHTLCVPSVATPTSDASFHSPERSDISLNTNISLISRVFSKSRMSLPTGPASNPPHPRGGSLLFRTRFDSRAAQAVLGGAIWVQLDVLPLWAMSESPITPRLTPPHNFHVSIRGGARPLSVSDVSRSGGILDLQQLQLSSQTSTVSRVRLWVQDNGTVSECADRHLRGRAASARTLTAAGGSGLDAAIGYRFSWEVHKPLLRGMALLAEGAPGAPEGVYVLVGAEGDEFAPCRAPWNGYAVALKLRTSTCPVSYCIHGSCVLVGGAVSVAGCVCR